MVKTRCQVSGIRCQGKRKWVLGAGCWVLGLLLVTCHSSLVTSSAQEPAHAQYAPVGDARAQKPSPPVADDRARPPGPPTAAKDIPIDDEFMEIYSDYALLVREIDRIATATGQITIPESLKSLQTRAQAKEKKMQAWIDTHNVARGSTLDVEGRKFIAPAEKKEAEKQEARSKKQGEKQ